MLDGAKLRAWWSHRQGLDGRLRGQSAAKVLEETGWARSVGGAGPYVGCFARSGVGRPAMDAELEQAAIHELPSARGCTYVVPACDFALALTVGQAFGDPEMTVARKLGVTDKEVDKLCDSIIGVLSRGSADPLDPNALKEALGGAVRNLGEAGKKKGVTTTLPLALGRLQQAGEIRRIPINGRLDQQRYRYTLWKDNPLRGSKNKPEKAHAELARRYFTWIGPATLAEFAQFAGLGVGASRKAIEPLKLVALEERSERLLLPEMREEFGKFRMLREPSYVLVSSLDGLSLHRRDSTGLLDEQDTKDGLWKALGSATPGTGGSLRDLPSHAIVDRGRIVGLWEYDMEGGSIVWAAFVKENRALKEAVGQMEAYVREDLGDARSFSLDSPRNRAPRITALRKYAARRH